jgi:hypothetical protein
MIKKRSIVIIVLNAFRRKICWKKPGRSMTASTRWLTGRLSKITLRPTSRSPLWRNRLSKP